MSMDGRTCIITGSARGIGRGIAEYLGAEGANVVINYRSSEDAAQSAVDAIEDAGGSAVAAQADVTDREEVVHMREVCHEAFGPADVLVNNAGITADVQFTEMSREDWDRVMDVNLGGMFNCTQEFFDDIWNAHEGRLINISSVVGKQGTSARPTTPPRKAVCSASPEPSPSSSRRGARRPTASPPASPEPTCSSPSPIRS